MCSRISIEQIAFLAAVVSLVESLVLFSLGVTWLIEAGGTYDYQKRYGLRVFGGMYISITLLRFIFWTFLIVGMIQKSNSLMFLWIPMEIISIILSFIEFIIRVTVDKEYICFIMIPFQLLSILLIVTILIYLRSLNPKEVVIKA